MRTYARLTLAALLTFGFAATALAGPSTEVHGFVDTSIEVPISPDFGPISLGFDQAEIDVMSDVGDGLSLRIDVDTTGAAVGLEQAFFKYYFNDGASRMYLLAGRTNAPIGVEAVDAPDMYQWSHGQLFNSVATNLDGFFLGMDGGTFNWMVMLTNDFDAGKTAADATLGLRLEYAPETWHLGLTGTFGPLKDDPRDPRDPRILIDVDSHFDMGDLTLWAEVMMQMFDAASPGNAVVGGKGTLIGFLAKGNYAFDGINSATLRFDLLNKSPDGGDSEMDMSVAVAYLHSFTKHFSGVVEINAFLPGADGADEQITGAIEFVAGF